MDGSSLQRIRDALLSRRSHIDAEFVRDQKEVGASIEVAGASAEIIDIAQSLEHIDRRLSLAEQERRELAAIERALAKIAVGSFGVCEECDEEIPSRRLMAIPHARLCAKCQELEEKQRSRARAA